MTSCEAREYSFSRPWGVPVRYHDFDEYNNSSSPDIFEFHLSYGDMKLNINEYLSGKYECDFAVHAPELFSNSRLMDLASEDENYRRFSIDQTQAVIDITRELKKYFPQAKSPLIIANIGGFSTDAPISIHKRAQLYEIFASSLAELDLLGVELIPQTMAPFPWHFGGQRFQNLFIDPDEIVTWCNELELRMCLDVSHSKLACNHFGWNFEVFVEKVGPLAAHLHLGDASGVNGEGLQIGEGGIDFEVLNRQLNILCPRASFIPEIWQGHKNRGEGFWIALEKLEGKL
jgi:sugar phosphate isomerase/epimerase